MKRIFRCLALALSLLLLLSACAPAAEDTGSTASASAAGSSGTASTLSTPLRPDTITMGANSEPSRLDPQNNGLIMGIMIEKQIYEPLIDKDPETGEFIPRLATEWEWLDDTHLKLRLREGVTFHNGDTFDAEDVMHTLDRISTGGSSASLYSAFDPEASTADGDYEVTIAFKYPFAPALNFLTNGRAYIVSKQFYDENGPDGLNQNPMGTGPYKFVEWVVSSHVVMERNDDYWGEKARIPNLVVRFIVEDTSRMVALETGEIDLCVGLQDSDITSVLNGEVEHINGQLVVGQQVNYLGFNVLDTEYFKDKRVRQAMAHAVDWKEVCRVAGGSLFQAADSCIAPTIEYYKSIGIYEYDPELAKELLTEAGYPDGFSFTMNISEAPASVRLVEGMQAYYKEVGLDMVISVVDNATWNDINLKGTCDTSILNMTATTGDPNHTLSQTIKGGTTRTGEIADPYYNELYQAGVQEMDTTKRQAIYEEIQQYMYDEVLQIPVYVAVISYGYRDYVEGLICDPGQQIDFARISFQA